LLVVDLAQIILDDLLGQGALASLPADTPMAAIPCSNRHRSSVASLSEFSTAVIMANEEVEFDPLELGV
jgi:hypothetical protein